MPTKKATRVRVPTTRLTKKPGRAYIHNLKLVAAYRVTDEALHRLEVANRALEEDPSFLTEVQEALATSQLRLALETSGVSQAELARRWEKSRQYVSKLLGEKLTNYTLETITHAAYHLGLRVSVKLHRPDEVAVIKSV